MFIIRIYFWNTEDSRPSSSFSAHDHVIEWLAFANTAMLEHLHKENKAPLSIGTPVRTSTVVELRVDVSRLALASVIDTAFASDNFFFDVTINRNINENYQLVRMEMLPDTYPAY